MDLEGLLLTASVPDVIPIPRIGRGEPQGGLDGKERLFGHDGTARCGDRIDQVGAFHGRSFLFDVSRLLLLPDTLA